MLTQLHTWSAKVMDGLLCSFRPQWAVAAEAAPSREPKKKSQADRHTVNCPLILGLALWASCL